MVSTTDKQVPLGKKIRAHLELADPVTWFSPAIITICGALAAGAAFDWTSGVAWAWIMLGALMTGPLGTGFSQSINDYYDHELDAINDPKRPIPAGLVTLGEARINWIFLGTATFLVSLVFGNPWIVFLAVLGLFISVIYSKPPIKLKKNFWFGPASVGLGYVTMSWLAGHLIFASLTWQSFVVAVINGTIAAGMLFLNDIKSVEGDRRLGLKSLPVVIGLRPTLIIAYTTIGISQVLLVVLAFIWGYYWAVGFFLLSIIAPIYSQVQLYQDPSQRNYIRYLVASNPFMVLTQVVSAFIVGGYFR
ncbi:(bacterio)chlorophyll synthase [Candidatus Viridilinea mediisalina]|uniref:Bacteriochlorophyll/chlorophyll synthetase n=1 Tax=Candidatus Viridilinea mediisalina TaxID=2024553 RepID=A0A2A6RMM2_9CHLR|nr:(bacterio)chlorophyll synthase [Candidatus Viridilinea mediisalina]PDW04109.1 bacteriochlorophyll/chlorophyll synthetase [Candidatus Viridilinea mediisalina]